MWWMLQGPSGMRNAGLAAPYPELETTSFQVINPPCEFIDVSETLPITLIPAAFPSASFSVLPSFLIISPCADKAVQLPDLQQIGCVSEESRAVARC